jgi:excisionase family DNA binding protein
MAALAAPLTGYRSIRQIAEDLNISPDHLHRMVREGRLPAVRLGARKGIVIHSADLQEYLDSARV